MTSLSNKVFSATVWSALERFGQQGVLIIVQLVLAAKLGPEVFGLLAMLLIFYAVAQSLVNSGFSFALIQKQEIDSLDCSSMFYFNIVLGVVVAGAMCAVSPLVAWFYGKPILQPMMCALAIVPFINSFGLVQETLLRRELKFKRLMIATFPATVLSGAIGIVLAYNGWGVWSLVIQMVSLRFIWVGLMWFASAWRPTREFSAAALKKMFGFGSKVMVEGLATVIFDNLYLLVIGKVFDAVSLGLYSNARKLQHLVSVNLTAILSRVAFPVFSRLQDDTERMRRGFSRAVGILILFNGLICALMVATADPLFRGVLGNEWIGSIPYFQWLAAVALFYPLSSVNLNVLIALGRSDLFLMVGVVKKVLIVLNLAIAWRWGVMAIVYGQVAIALLSFLINAHYTGKFLRYPAWAQLWEGVGGLLAAGSTAVVMTALAQLGRGLPYLLIAFGQVVIGVGFWLAVCYAFDLRAFHELIKILRNRSNANG